MSGVAAAIQVWQERRDILLHELHDLPLVIPHGGWSLLLDTVTLGRSPAEASSRLFKEAKIATTPMIGWGENAARYLRFVFSNETEQRFRGIGNKVRSALGI